MAEFNGIVNVDIRDSIPDWTPFLQPQAPEGAPNVLMIVWDDVGYGAMSAFGGPIETPTMERIAEKGIRYSNFHTTALCSPTRSSLLTGRNATSNNMACITEASAGFPGFSARIPFENGTIAEVLNERGWNTYAIGKWHLTPGEETDASSWKGRWPLGRGFERFYGFLGGETSQWYPDLVEDNHPIEQPASPEEGYHLSADLADKSIRFVRDAKASRAITCHAPRRVPPTSGRCTWSVVRRSRGWVAQARKPPLDATAGWTARARGHGPWNHQGLATSPFQWMRRTIGMFIYVSVLTSCISTEEPRKVVSVPPRAPTNAPAPQGGEHHPTWPVRTNQRTGITIRVPPSWSLVWNPLRDGTLGDILVAGSMRFPTLPECEPIPRGRALLALSEFRPSENEPLEGLERDFTPRPHRFETSVLRSSQVRKGCIQPRAQLFRFLEADRFLYAWVMFGRDPSTGLRTKTEAVLSTLEVNPSE